MKLWTLAFVFTAALGLSKAEAHEQDFGTFKGDGLHLSYTDHAMAGSIGSTLIYASPLADTFGITATFRSEGKDHKATFAAPSEGKDVVLAGTVSVSERGENRDLTLKILGIESQAGEISGTLNERPFTVRIKADTMAGHHYVNPTFEVTYGEHAYTFALEGASACLGCAAKITSIVLPFLHLSGKI